MRLASGLVALSCALAGPAAAVCPTSGDAPAHVATVEQRLELRLADGRLIRLAGLDPALQTPRDPDLGETARTRLAAVLAGRDVTLQLLASKPDRWGRFAAFVFLAGTPPTEGGAAAAAIAAGLGRTLSEPAAHECRDALLAAEQAARTERLGLWADPYYSVLAVDDHASFIERAGTNVVAEGRLTEVVPGTYRTTLRFAALTDPGSEQRTYAGHMLAATILPRAMKSFEAQQVDVRSHIGQRLRFRGLLDLRFGPRIELASPDDVEFVTTPGGVAPTHPD